MVRYAEWREAIDPERPHEGLDPAIRLAVASLVGVGGLACCVYGSIPAFIYVWRAMGDRQLERHVERLRDVPARQEQHACRLTLFCDGIEYGADEGLVSFVDGSMLFEGRRTSFSVPRSDADARHLVGGGLAFRFEGPGGAHQATVEALDRTRMADSYRMWLGQPVGSEEAIVFPPVRPERSALRRAKGRSKSALASLALGVVAGEVAGVQMAWPVGLGFLIVGVVLALALAASSRRRRAALSRLGALPEPVL